MGEQRNIGDSTDFLVPQVVTPGGGWPIGSIGDYFGLYPPIGIKLILSAPPAMIQSAIPLWILAVAIPIVSNPEANIVTGKQIGRAHV